MPGRWQAGGPGLPNAYPPGAARRRMRAVELAVRAALLVARLVGQGQQSWAGPMPAGQADGDGDGVEGGVARGRGQEGGAARRTARQPRLAARAHRVPEQALPDWRRHRLVAHGALEPAQQHPVQVVVRVGCVGQSQAEPVSACREPRVHAPRVTY